MNRDTWSIALKGVLLGHFDSLGDEEATRRAEELSGNLKTALTLQSYIHKDRAPELDVESLLKAANALTRAAKYIDELGVQGSKALPEVLRQSLPNPVEVGLSYPEENLKAQQVLASLIRVLADEIKAASSKINMDAPSVMAAFGEEFESNERHNSKKQKIAAEMFARECSKLYDEVTGKRPTLPSSDGVPYGPFLAFISDAFKACQIDASPVVWAKYEVKKFSSKIR